MSAKEQAIALVEKYRGYCFNLEQMPTDGETVYSKQAENYNAKACAIICCDEIIATLKWNETKKENHWQEVKKQIELL